MRLQLVIRNNKKNKTLRSWFALFESLDYEDTISAVVCGAVEYYARTGNFLKVGGIKSVGRELNKNFQTIYISDKSFVANWLNEQVKQGEKKGTLVKMILKNSLAEGEDWIISLAELKLNVLKPIADGKAKIPQEISNVPERKETKKEPEQVASINEQKPNMEKKEKKTDLVDALIPGGFGI